MRMIPTAEQLRAKAGVGITDYDFYKCHKCGSLITRIEEIQMFDKLSSRYGQACLKCGSPKYTPTNLMWFHWFLPKVWVFAFYRLRGIV